MLYNYLSSLKFILLNKKFLIKIFKYYIIFFNNTLLNVDKLEHEIISYHNYVQYTFSLFNMHT
jgi:hypothetical protein